MRKTLLSPGNAKLGKIPSWSLPAGLTCPGRSDQCRKLCYAAKLERVYTSAARRWLENLTTWRRDREAWRSAMIQECRRHKVVRLHVSGDFFSTAYCWDWRRVIEASPDTSFFGYTRSWTRKRLEIELLLLQDLPNVVLFASWDPSMAQAPPAGWRIAVMGRGDHAAIQCPTYSGKVASCDQCGICFKHKNGPNVRFPIH